MAKKKASEDNIFNFIASELDGDVLADAAPVTYFLDTGNLAFNWVLSGKFMGGGIPGGKITEFFGPEASGKCIAEDMEVLLTSGQIKTIKEIVETKDSTPLVSLNEITKKFEAMKVDQFWSNGEKECWEATTRTGRKVTTTRNHEYLTPNGWKYLEDIKEGEMVAVPRKTLSSIRCKDIACEQYMEAGTFWDEVVSIVCVGNRKTYDLGVKEHHNFVANDFIVHNSYWGANIARGAQAIGGIPVYLDCENSLNNDFVVKTSHIDLKRIVRFDPSSGVDCLEGVFNKIYTVIKKVRNAGDTRPIVFIYDSIASSPCARALRETEIDTDKCSKEEFKSVVGGKEQPGERAKICSKEFSKLGTLLEKTNSTVLVLNQTRMKIGVMYGCFFGDTLVSFADGRRIPIKTVVENKLKGPVLSYDLENGKIVETNITDWFINGKLDYAKGERWLHFLTNGGSEGKMGFTCTPDHKIMRYNSEKETEWVAAKDVEKGDSLVSYYESFILNDKTHHDIIFGSLLGDGTLKRRKFNTSCFSIANQEQPEYLLWKQSMLPLLSLRKGGNNERPRLDSDYSVELNLLKDKFYPFGHGYRQIPLDLELTDLMFAVWYMDDGHIKNYEKPHWLPNISINIKRFRNQPDMIMKARNMVASYLGCDVSEITYQHSGCNLHIPSELSKLCFKKMCKYIPSCMEYKLPESYRGKYYSSVQTELKKVLLPYPVLVISKKIGSARMHRNLKKYDIEVGEFSNYLVGGGSKGVIVSNSPETTAGGGESLKFYASCRVRTSIQKKIENKKLKTSIGINLKVTNKKNRCCSPFREAEGVHLYWNDGVNPLSGLLTCLIQDERIDKVGNGVYIVKEPWAGGQEIKFRASKAKNEIEPDVLYKCPALIDAPDEQSVRDYFDIFGAAIKAGNNEENEETDASNDESSDDDYGD